ncbi:MAG: hypothetical protein RLY47_219 [Candidatus Parcubacteria bacterium]
MHGGSRSQEGQALRIPAGSEVPNGRDTQIASWNSAAPGIEAWESPHKVADNYVGTHVGETRRADQGVHKQHDTTHREVRRDEPGHLNGVGYALDVRQTIALIMRATGR